jgi:hypothetical protein
MRVSGRPVIRALVPSTDPKVTGDNFYLHDRSELLIAVNASGTTSLYKGQVVETLQGVIADSHGLWFGGFDGIYLYTAANGLQRVSDHAGMPANGCF